MTTEAIVLGLLAGVGGLLMGGLMAGSWVLVGIALGCYGALAWMITFDSKAEEK